VSFHAKAANAPNLDFSPPVGYDHAIPRVRRFAHVPWNAWLAMVGAARDCLFAALWVPHAALTSQGFRLNHDDWRGAGWSTLGIDTPRFRNRR